MLLGSVILYNLGSLPYMERYRDMATLKVLGFHDKRIRSLMVQQNLWLAALGAAIGLPAYLLVNSTNHDIIRNIIKNIYFLRF